MQEKRIFKNLYSLLNNDSDEEMSGSENEFSSLDHNIFSDDDDWLKEDDEQELLEKLDELEKERDRESDIEEESQFLFDSDSDCSSTFSQTFSSLSYSSNGFLNFKSSLKLENIITEIALFIIKTKASFSNVKLLFKLINNIIDCVQNQFNLQENNYLLKLLTPKYFFLYHNIKNLDRVYYCTKCKEYTIDNKNSSKSIRI
ncbi:hypothetical protein ABK040_003024 [Willaertia magna]